MYTMVLSISHRITGVLLSLGSILFAYWLLAVALGPEAYATAREVLSSGFAKLVWAGLVVSFCYHLVNGLRHLAWDCGWGLEKREARASGWGVVVLTAVLSLAVFAASFHFLGAGA
jgi:succinate dehydrogenase / fumarate reductase, cytochrome b subunit